MPVPPRTSYRKILYYAPNAIHDGWKIRGHVDSVLQNGVGRFICQLKRLTFFFCKEREDSFGVRQFIEQDLVDFADKNPGVAIYVQPKRHISPYMIGEYLNDRQAHIHASAFTRQDMILWTNHMRSRSGLPVVHFQHNWRTENPSIQGMWDPFSPVPTQMNVEELPSKNFSHFQSPQLTASEIVLKLMEEKESLYPLDESQSADSSK